MTDSVDPDQELSASAERIVEAFGGIRPMAARLGVPVTTVQGWKKRGTIPPARHGDVRRAAREAGIDLSALPPAAAGESQVKTENASPPPFAGPGAGGDSSASGSAAPTAAPPVPPVQRFGATGGHEAARDAEEAERARAAQKVRENPVFFTEAIPPELVDKLRGLERKSGRTAALVASGLVGVALGLALVLLWPTARKVDEVDDRLTAVEGTVMHLGEGESAGNAPDTGWAAELDRRMEDWKRQAGQVRSEVESAIGQARQAAEGVVGPQAGPLSERIAKLEEKVQEISGSPALSDLMARLESYTGTVEGQGRLDALVARLRALADGSAATTAPSSATDGTPEAAAPEDFANALDRARAGDAELGAAFEGVAPGDLKAAAMLVAFTKLRGSLNRGNTPFEDDLGLLLNLVGDDNPELKESLVRLAPHAKEGILTPEGLSQQLRGLAGDVVAASLKGEDVSFEERARARVNEVLRIEKKGELISGTDTQSQLYKAQSALDSGDIPSAIGALQGIDGAAAGVVQPLIEQAQATAAAAQLRDLLDRLSRARTIGAGSKYTTGFKGLSDLVPSQPVVKDEASGVTVIPPSPEIPHPSPPPGGP